MLGPGMKWGGDDKDGRSDWPEPGEIFQGYRVWRGLVVNRCMWAGEGLMKSLGLDRGFIYFLDLKNTG